MVHMYVVIIYEQGPPSKKPNTGSGPGVSEQVWSIMYACMCGDVM